MIHARPGRAGRGAGYWTVAWMAAAPVVGAADLAEVAARGLLRVVVAADEAPETFSFRPGGPPGFERELIEGFARLRGLKVHAVPARGHADRIPMLVRGEGDVILAIFDTEDRRRLVDFTAEVMPTHNVAVTLASRPPVESLDELRAARVGVIRGAKPAEEAVQAGLPAAALVAFDRREQLLAALQNGTVAAAILPVSELAVVPKRFARLRAGVVVGAPGKVAWAVRKTDDALEAALNEYIGNVRRGPTWSRLIVKYFGDQALAVLGRGQK
jgi:ABC-type amino acid transport substrate-binding protein